MKILITHASAGAGHLKAAEAIYEGLKSNAIHNVILVDALDLTSPLFKKLYRESYSFLVTKIPIVWKFAFFLLDIPLLQPLVRGFRRIYNAINARGLAKYMVDEQFDCIVSTHFMPTEVSCALKRKGKIRARIVTCVTDFDVHRIWIADGVDMYTVASDWTKGKMKSLGVEEKQVFATGIPTNEKFSALKDIASLKKTFSLHEDAFTVLIATGSFGIGPIEALINSLEGFQVVVICGHNKSLFEKLSQNKSELTKIFGLVDNMDEMMAVSDVMVTKPGGLSISEALVCQLPLIFFSAIPGQETNNIHVLAQHGVGLNTKSVNDIVSELKKLKSSKDYFLTALKKTAQLAKPSAVKDIVALIN